MFELSPATGGTWTEAILYSFNANGTDGYDPSGSLVLDAAGNLYGTTYWGGPYNGGIVFQLTASGDGSWTETVLHNFNEGSGDGAQPIAGVIFDPAGNLYGTTMGGGGYSYGTVFELSHGAGTWSETVLHSFNDVQAKGDGFYPYASLLIDGAGNLYGTTFQGGKKRYGTVFELSPEGNGEWAEAILYNFASGTTDGANPAGSLIFGKNGDLYGTTVHGGSLKNGTIFELQPFAGRVRILHAFNPRGSGSVQPYAGFVADTTGNFYGTTTQGGDFNNGTVFEVLP